MVALSGAAEAPRFRGRWEIGLILPDNLAAQPHPAASGLDLAATGQLIGQAGRGAEDAAAAGLRAAPDTPPAYSRNRVRSCGRSAGNSIPEGICIIFQAAGLFAVARSMPFVGVVHSDDDEQRRD